MLVMLIQSIIGVSDDEIIHDYFLSSQMLKGEGSAAIDATMDQNRKRGRMHRGFFTGASREAMTTTLAYLRNKYGSISPGYLNHIGFDECWRKRLIVALTVSATSRSKL